MGLQALDIADWRRCVFGLYAEVRAAGDPESAHGRWRAGREALFRHHPQSPVIDAPGREAWVFQCYPYDAALRFTVVLDEVTNAEAFTVPVGEDGDLRLRPCSRTRGLSDALGTELTIYWMEGYGGGLFLPFADATSGNETYGGGRYVLDTIKGADLGSLDDKLVLDFNFAYQPSCAYSPRWTCPLAPLENRVALPIRVGERVG